MPTDVRAHIRKGRLVRRYLRAGDPRLMNPKRLTGGYGKDLVERARAEGYAARGPWEVFFNDDRIELFHYAFPIVTVNRETGNTTAQGRPGYGMSASDVDAAKTFLLDLGYEPYQMPQMERGRVADPRLLPYVRGGTKKGAGLISPYATVDEARLAESRGMFGPEWVPYTLTDVPFSKRRGYAPRKR